MKLATTTLSFCLGAALLLSACAQSEPEIIRIVDRERVIVIRPGGAEPTYSVESTNGSVILPAMSLAELMVRAPDVHERIEQMESGQVHAGSEPVE